MPPPTRSTATTRDDILEAFRDPLIADAIAKALGPYIARAIDEAFGAKIAALDATVSDLKQENRELSDRISSLEAYTRCDQLVIRGIPDLSYADKAAASVASDGASAQESSQVLIDTVVNLCTVKLGVQVEARDISNVHRLKGGKNDKYRPVIVRFVARRVRNAVYAAKKSLKGSDQGATGIFISEHLTKEAGALFYETRKLVRDRLIHATWTQGGSVYIRRTSDPSGRPSIIANKLDLAAQLSRTS